MTVELVCEVSIPPGTAVVATVFEDRSGDEAAEGQQAVGLAHGRRRYRLESLQGAAEHYWIAFELRTNDEHLSPAVRTATLDPDPPAVRTTTISDYPGANRRSMLDGATSTGRSVVDDVA